MTVLLPREGGTGIDAPSTNALLVGRGTLPMSEIPAGADGDVLTSQGPGLDPAWETPDAVVSDHGALTGLADDDHTQYLLAVGTRALSGFWNTGAQKVGFNTTSSTGQANVKVTGTATPGIFFNIGSTATEALWDTVAGGYGWRMIAENSANGNLYLQANAANLRYMFARDSSYFKVGTSSWTKLASETIGGEGMLHMRNGASFNTAGGSTDPQNYFKVYGSAGDGGTPLLYINPATGGVGFGTTGTTGGVLNYGSGRTSTSKAGLAVVCAGVADNLLEWTSSAAYGSSAYGFGKIQDEAATGDQLIFAKKGSATDYTVLYFKRSNQYVGAGSSFGFGAVPQESFHASANIRAETSLMAGDDRGSGVASFNTITGNTDTPTADPGWAASSSVDMTAPDGYIKAYVGTQAVVIPYWNT